MNAAPDPRPLVGEPLALDLLNTEWVANGAPVDLLATPGGLRVWLRSARIRGPASPDAGEALVQARAAIREVLTRPGPGGRARLNAVLGHGRIALALTRDGPERSVQVDDESWRPAVSAANNLLDLLSTAPDRIRQCQHPACVLWFLDTTRNGTRRWCSMAGCGNRAKASRHYARTRRQPPPGSNASGTRPSGAGAEVR